MEAGYRASLLAPPALEARVPSFWGYLAQGFVVWGPAPWKSHLLCGRLQSLARVCGCGKGLKISLHFPHI